MRSVSERGLSAADPPKGIVTHSGMRTPYAVAARELLRSTLFEAARHELARRRWNEVTMAEIAVTAGVSRQTLYK